jgi:hypothetical protein
MHLLELFSGTGSVGRAFERKGWTVTTVDLDAESAPSICCDVRDLDASSLPIVDLIWASPPCTHYSRARTKAKTPRDLEGSDELVQRVLELSSELGVGEKACPFFMENPYTGLLKTRDVVEGIPYQVVDYCKYGMLYRKRTAIWTNTSWKPLEGLCKRDCPSSSGRKKHLISAQRAHFDLETLYALPEKLCDELAEWATRETNRSMMKNA